MDLAIRRHSTEMTALDARASDAYCPQCRSSQVNKFMNVVRCDDCGWEVCGEGVGGVSAEELRLWRNQIPAMRKEIAMANGGKLTVDQRDKAFIGDERDRLIAAVAGTVVTHPITVDAIIGVIKAAGELSDYGYGAERLIREKLLEYKRKEPAS